MAKNNKNNYEVNEFDEALVASKSFFEKNKKKCRKKRFYLYLVMRSAN